MDVCSICECEFDLDTEGGVCGHIGMIIFELCPTCHAGLAEYYLEEYDVCLGNSLS